MNLGVLSNTGSTPVKHLLTWNQQLCNTCQSRSREATRLPARGVRVCARGPLGKRWRVLGLERFPGAVLRLLEDGERDFSAVGRFPHHIEHLTTTDIGFGV